MVDLPERYTECTRVLENAAVPTETVYHYTNWVGLTGILKKQQLWLTNVAHLNDTTEVKYALKTLREFILGLSLTDAAKDFFEQTLSTLKNMTPRFINFYVASFCAKKNHLYSWRAYSDDGAGYAIGFKPDFFKGSDKLPSGDAPNFGRGSVHYNIKQLASHIERLVGVVNNDLGHQTNSQPLFLTPEDVAACFAATVLPLLISIKHEAYCDEHEHRLYHSSHDGDMRQKFFSDGNTPNNPHLNPKKRIWYGFELNNISEIWVGPRLNYDHAKFDIEKLLDALKEEGHAVDNIKIQQSKIPYKNNY